MGTRRGGRRSGGGGGHTAASRHKAVAITTTTTTTTPTTNSSTTAVKLENERRNQETLKRLAGFLQAPLEETPAVVVSPDGLALKPGAPTLVPVISKEHEEDFNKTADMSNSSCKTKGNSNDIGNNKNTGEATYSVNNELDSGGCEERQRSCKGRDVVPSQQTCGSSINGHDSSLEQDLVRLSEVDSARAGVYNGRGRDASPTKKAGKVIPGTPAKPRNARNASPFKGRSASARGGGAVRDPSPMRAPAAPRRQGASSGKVMSKTSKLTSTTSMTSSLSSSSSPSSKMAGVFDRLTKSDSSKAANMNSSSCAAGWARGWLRRSPTKSQRETSPWETTGRTLTTSITYAIDMGETFAKGGRMDDRRAPRTQERPRGGLTTEARGQWLEEKNHSSSSQPSHGNTRGVTGQSAPGRGEQTRNPHLRGRDTARTTAMERTSASEARDRKEKGVGRSRTDKTQWKVKSRNQTPSSRGASGNSSEFESTPRTSKDSPGKPLGGTGGRGRLVGTGRPSQNPQPRPRLSEGSLQLRGNTVSSVGLGPTSSSSKASHLPRPRRPPSGTCLGSLHSSTSTSSITSLSSSTSSYSSFTATSPSPHSPSLSPSPAPSSKNIREGSSQGPTNCSTPAAAVRAATVAVQRASASQEKRLHSREERNRAKTLTQVKPKEDVEKKENVIDKDVCESTAVVTSCSTGKKSECDEEEKDVCDGDENEEGEFYKVHVQTRLVTYRDSTLVIRNTSKVAPTMDQEHGGTSLIGKSSSAGSAFSSDRSSGVEGNDGGRISTTTTSGSSSLYNQGDSHSPHPADTTFTTAPSPDGLRPSLQTSSSPEVLQGVSRPTPTTVTRHQRHHSDGVLLSFGTAKGTARPQNVGVTPEGDDKVVKDLSRLASLWGVRGRLSEFVNRGKLLVTDVYGAAAAQLPDMLRLQVRLTGRGSPFSREGEGGGGGERGGGGEGEGGGFPGGLRELEPYRTPLGGAVGRLSVSTPSSLLGVGELVGPGSEEGESGYFSWRQSASTPSIGRTVSLEEPSSGSYSQSCFSTTEGQTAHPRNSKTLIDKKSPVPPALGNYRRIVEAVEEDKAAKERQEREESEKDPACKELPKLTVLSTSSTKTSRTRKKSADEDTKGLKSPQTQDRLSGEEVSISIAPRRCERCNRIRKKTIRSNNDKRSDGEVLKGIRPSKKEGKKEETDLVDSNRLEGDINKLEGDTNKLKEEQSRTFTIEQVAETVSKEELDRERKEKSRLKKKSKINERKKGEDGKPGESSNKVRKKNDSSTILKEREEEEKEKEKEIDQEICTCTDTSGEGNHDNISSSALKDEVWQLLDADHARMWWTITGNFGNILPIDWSKTCTRQQYLPVLNLNQNKKGDGTEEGEGEDEDGEDEEEVAQDLDLHQLILSGLNQEPVKSAEEVIKEIDDIMQEGSSSEDETSEEGKKSDKEGDSTTPTQAPLPPPLYEEKLKNLSLSELNDVYMELEMVIRQYSETLISQLALRDELEYEKELKNSFISLLLQVQNKRRHFNVEKKKHKKTTGPNGTDPKYLTTVIPYDVGHGPPDNQTLQILIKILTAINEDSPTVPTLLTDYILKVLCPS